MIFAVDATSFLVSAAFLSFTQPRAYERAASEGLRRELSTGLRYVLKVPWFWITIATFSVVLMVGYAAFQVLLPKLVEQEWNGGVGSYGLLFTLQGVGMLIGSVVLGQTAPTRRRGTTIYSLFAINSAFSGADRAVAVVRRRRRAADWTRLLHRLRDHALGNDADAARASADALARDQHGLVRVDRTLAGSGSVSGRDFQVSPRPER